MLVKPDSLMLQKLITDEKDERYRFLLRHGNVHSVEMNTNTIYVEMKQIPNVIIVYRRPVERQANPEKILLDSRNLQAVPLLEGEEAIKTLVLSNNSIRKIDHLVSLPNL